MPTWLYSKRLVMSHVSTSSHKIIISIKYVHLVVKMRVPMILSLLMTTLIETSVQQCTKERFEARAQGLVFESIASDASAVTSPSDVLINETYYNCLATSENIGTYTSMSVSLTYTISGDSDTLQDIRYVMVCSGGNWGRLAENNDALKNNETRTDCHRCTDTAINEEYCSREYKYISIGL